MHPPGAVVPFDAVAREADVSRSWLYNQPELRAEIERLRQRKTPSGRRPVPDHQRASDASLQRRLELASERVRHLEADNKRLRRALAEALGDRRTAASHDPSRNTPRRQESPMIGPC